MPDGTCENRSIRSEEGSATDFDWCGCCMADCPDVGHPEPRPDRIIPGTIEVAEEYVATLPGEKQRNLRAQESRGELRIVSRAEMAGRFHTDDDIAPPK
jgi:hypothetical protein